MSVRTVRNAGHAVGAPRALISRAALRRPTIGRRAFRIAVQSLREGTVLSAIVCTERAGEQAPWKRPRRPNVSPAYLGGLPLWNELACLSLWPASIGSRRCGHWERVARRRGNCSSCLPAGVLARDDATSWAYDRRVQVLRCSLRAEEGQRALTSDSACVYPRRAHPVPHILPPYTYALIGSVTPGR